MIIPNLMTTNMAKSVSFYKDIIGLDLIMAISNDKKMLELENYAEAVFCVLQQGDSQLMIQTRESLSEELNIFDASSTPTASGTIYIRDHDPLAVQTRASEDHVIKGPSVTWYGMNELYLKDPDGYVVCIGMPEGDFNPG